MTHPDPNLMEMDEVARILPDLDQWMAWANKLKAYALEQARDKGAEIPGYKLVRGRANRAWNDSKDIVEELKSAGVSETVIYSEPSLRSVAQLEKALGKKEFAPLASKLVVTPLGTPALVPISDPREAVNKVSEAHAAFGIDK